MKNLNIALLHYSSFPVVGGVEEVMCRQALLFDGYSHNVKIFAGSGQQFTNDLPVEINPLLSSTNKKVLDAHKLALKGKIKPIELLTQTIYNYLKKALQGFDFLIAHNVLSMHYNLPLTRALHKIASEGFIKIISWNHDSPYFYDSYPSHLNKKQWDILKQYNPKICYVVISDIRKRQFAKLYGKEKQIRVIPNGIDPATFFNLSPLTIRLVKEQHLFDVDFLIIQPSRLHPRKNIELSLYVVRALRKKGINVRLLITGSYDPHEPKSVEYHKKLVSLSKKLQVEKDVIFLVGYKFKNGQQITSDKVVIRDLCLISDILFMSSLQEGFGIPLLEAGVIKLPVVCSNIPSFKEIGGKDVCFFDLDNTPNEIAEKIINFVSGIRTQSYFRRIIKNYTWHNIYKAHLLPLLKSVIK